MFPVHVPVIMQRPVPARATPRADGVTCAETRGSSQVDVVDAVHRQDCRFAVRAQTSWRASHWLPLFFPHPGRVAQVSALQETVGIFWRASVVDKFASEELKFPV